MQGDGGAGEHCGRLPLLFPVLLASSAATPALLQPLPPRRAHLLLRSWRRQGEGSRVRIQVSGSRATSSSSSAQALSMLCCWIENSNSDAFKRHLARVADFLWLGEDGMKVNSNSDAFKRHLARVADFLWLGEDGMKVRVCAGQSWDVAFAVQAVLACNVAEEFGSTLKKAHHFIIQSQASSAATPALPQPLPPRRAHLLPRSWRRQGEGSRVRIQVSSRLARHFLSFFQALSMLCCWIENSNSDAFKRHLARVADFLWLGEDGMKVRVCAGQSWDVAFAVQAVLACNVAEEFGSTLKKAHHFIKQSQIVNNPSGDFRKKHRHISKGGWAFQVADQGWQPLLLLAKFPSDIVGDQMETCRFHDALNVLLSLQAEVLATGGGGLLHVDVHVGRPADAVQGRGGHGVPAQALREPHAQPG